MGMTEEDRRRLEGSGGSFDPITAPIPEASRVSGLSCSEIYRRLAAGDISAVKSGSRTLIVMDSLRSASGQPPRGELPRPESRLKRTAPSAAAPGAADRVEMAVGNRYFA